MKDLFKKVSMFLTAFVLCFALVGCGGGGGGEDEPEEQDVDSAYISLDDYKAYILDDFDNATAGIADYVDASLNALISAQKTRGINAINACHTVAEVKAMYSAALNDIADIIPLADGIKTYVSLSNAERTEILGILESYAIKNGTTGISLFENGGYVMYNERVTLGTENYIVGYGFGVLSEGSINADLEAETNADWKRYYHTFEASDPGTINYLNDQGSQVGDIYGFMGASFYTTVMNATKDGYDWIPELATAQPIAVNDTDGDGVATTWKFPVAVGEDLKYNTNSSIASRQAFDGREVALEDYLTPFKFLLTQYNNLYRGGELAQKTGAGAIVGALAYYNGSSDGYNAELWNGVGLKTFVEDGVSYFQVEYTTGVNQFYCRYYISSSMYMPVPQEFLDLVNTVEGGEPVINFLGYNADKTETPVDNSLSLGSYTLERWDSGQQIVFKKNPYYVYGDIRYSIPGVHINILTAATEDPEAGINEFLAGKLDASGIPQTKLDEYKSDPRTRQTKGDSNFKLNVNAADAETWESLFGVNGSYTPTASEDDYWEVEPALNNSHFVKALSLSINRLEFASARGSVPSVDFFSSSYMSDPENGISYSATQAHKDAVAGLLPESYGYNLELSREYFRVALAELEADGKYTAGTVENPTIIHLEIAWMYPSHEDLYHNEIKQYFETAFNDASVSGGKYKLEISFWVGEAWSDVYYDKLLTGYYDIGFGSISGNELNPLDFMSVLSSDPVISGEFTLNWGPDTNDPNSDILVYDGMRWSYDALWTAANTQAIVKNGALTPSTEWDMPKFEAKADGSFDVTITCKLAIPEKMTLNVEDFVVCWYDGAEYDEVALEAACFSASDEVNGVVTITANIPASVVSAYPGAMGIDVYYSLEIDGQTSTGLYKSFYGEFPA